MNKKQKLLAMFSAMAGVAPLAVLAVDDPTAVALAGAAGTVSTLAGSQTLIIAGLVGIVLAGLVFYFFKTVVKHSK